MTVTRSFLALLQVFVLDHFATAVTYSCKNVYNNRPYKFFLHFDDEPAGRKLSL
jgi:hypothetical protein